MKDDEISMTETDDMRGTVAGTVGHATSDAQSAIAAAADAAHPAVDRLAANIHHAVDRVAGTATEAAESLDAKSRQLRDAQVRLTERCCAQVREKPMASLGIAAGAGLLLGWLLGRR